jgi:ribonucleoside-diphosphate reductase beta chain
MTTVLDNRVHYKPFQYPWAFEYWKQQQQVHWLPYEVPLHSDVKDWNHNLTPEQKSLLTQIFRFFTQSDLEVNNCYMRQYAKANWAPEVTMMLTAFANMETVHIAAYSHLMDTVGMPETEYSMFMNYKAMKDKHDYTAGFYVDPTRPSTIAKQLALFGAFTEGLQLFSSFAILLNFPRFNKMKGMGQIISWSVRDESLHCEALIRLYHTIVDEFDIDRTRINTALVQMCRDVVDMEDAFVDLAFSGGAVEGLSASEVKQYVRWIADRRLEQLGLSRIFLVTQNPLPWLDAVMNGVEHTNFFEQRATEYSKAASAGEWGDVKFKPSTWKVLGKDGCEWCFQAKQLLRLRGQSFSYVDLTGREEEQRLSKSTFGHSTFPMVFKDGKLIGGFKELEQELSN